MYAKIIKRSILITLALLFIIPLAIQAQDAAFGPERGPVYVPKSIVIRTWEFRDAGGVVARPWDGRQYGPRVVAKNMPFKLTWGASGILPGTDKEESSAGIKCVNNWNDSNAASGEVRGTLSSSRVFRIVCAGLLGGWMISSPVVVGTPDLSVLSAQLTGLKPWGITGGTIPNTYVSAPHKVSVAFRNSGNVPVSSPFTIRYYISTDPKVESIDTKNTDFTFSDGIKAGETKTIDLDMFAPDSGYSNGIAGATLSSAVARYHKICLDAGNAVAEENKAGTGETNNCKILDGSYKYVMPNAENPAPAN